MLERSPSRPRLAVVGGTLTVAVLLAAPALRAADGDPFGNGIVLFDLGGTKGDAGAGVAVQDDGAVVVIGTVATGAGSWQMALSRSLPNGTLDGSFGSGGRVVDPFGLNANSTGVAIHRLADGRFLVAGTLDLTGGDHDFIVGRLLEDGSPDPSFNAFFQGRVRIAFDLGGDRTDTLAAMAVDAAGGVVVVGSVDVSASDIDIGVARVTPSGELDSSFSGDGKTTLPISLDQPDYGLSVAIDRDGRVVIGGTSWQPTLSGGQFNGVVAVLQGNGAVDSDFGAGGTYVFDYALGGTKNEFCWALGVWPDGEIVVAGDVAVDTDSWQWFVLRLTADASSTDSLTGSYCGSPASLPCLHPPQDSVRALRLEPDGKIVLAGFGLAAPGEVDLGIARLTRDLFWDLSFAGDATALYDFSYGTGAGVEQGHALAFDADGRLVVAGAVEFDGLDTDFAWVRFDNSYTFADGFEWGDRSRWSASVP